MKWIKIICAFLIAFIGMCMMYFFGLVGIISIKGLFSYPFTYCSDLMVYTIFFAIGVLGVVIGSAVFCDGVDKLKNS